MERERKRKLAALMAALLHGEAERAWAAAAQATPSEEAGITGGSPFASIVPGPVLWSLAGRRDHMDLRVMCQLRMGKSA